MKHQLHPTAKPAKKWHQQPFSAKKQENFLSNHKWVLNRNNSYWQHIAERFPNNALPQKSACCIIFYGCKSDNAFIDLVP